MSKLRNWRSLSFLLWIVITITMIVTMPNMDKLVKEKGHITIPNTEQSSIADKMIKEMNKDGTEKYEIIAVFNSGSKTALTTEQKAEITKTINALQNEMQRSLEIECIDENNIPLTLAIIIAIELAERSDGSRYSG